MKAHFYKERKEIETNNQTIEDFLHEASIMRQFDHPNVLSIYGVSVHKEKTLCFVASDGQWRFAEIFKASQFSKF